jgi:hypothetical protein
MITKRQAMLDKNFSDSSHYTFTLLEDKTNSKGEVKTKTSKVLCSFDTTIGDRSSDAVYMGTVTLTLGTKQITALTLKISYDGTITTSQGNVLLKNGDYTIKALGDNLTASNLGKTFLSKIGDEIKVNDPSIDLFFDLLALVNSELHLDGEHYPIVSHKKVDQITLLEAVALNGIHAPVGSPLYQYAVLAEQVVNAKTLPANTNK